MTIDRPSQSSSEDSRQDSIEGILLDLDNTVYDYRRAHEPALANALGWLALQLDKSRYEVDSAYFDCRKRVNSTLHGLAASHSRLLYFQGVCEHFGRLPHLLAGEAEDVYWTVFFENMVLRAGCHAFFESFSYLPICIVTDLTTRIQFDKIAKLEIARFIKAIVTSEEAGQEKPHDKIFMLAAAKLGLPMERLCMIGDSYERDIEGALKLGVPGFWLNTGDNGAEPTPNAPNLHPDAVTVFNDFESLSALLTARLAPNRRQEK